MAKDKMAISASLKQVNKRGGGSQQWMSCSLLLSSFVFISLQDHKAQRKKNKQTTFFPQRGEPFEATWLQIFWPEGCVSKVVIVKKKKMNG